MSRLGFKRAPTAVIIKLEAEIAAEYGLTVASEFHRNTYNDTRETCLAYLKQCGMENLKTYWQPMYAGEDFENLRAVAGQTEVAHLFCWNQSGSRRYPLKKGEKEIGLFLRELLAQGYQGDLLLEFVKPACFIIITTLRYFNNATANNCTASYGA